MVCANGQTTPPPYSVNPVPPYQISDAELNKLSLKDIALTAKHLVKLYQDEHATRLSLEQNIKEATTFIGGAISSTSNGLVHVDSLQDGIQKLADHDKKETERANKLDKALWWYRLHWWGAWVMLGLGVVTCVLFAILKATGKISFNAAQVAAKLPI